jgi:cyanophycinase-like exopeptidase
MPPLPNIPRTLPGAPIVLIGGGEFSFGETEEIDRWLLAHARSKRVAFLPTASGSPDYAKHFGAWLQRLDPAVEVINVPVYRRRDARRQKNMALISGAGLIYIGGGVASEIGGVWSGEPVVDFVGAAVASGIPLAAIGAAASFLGAAAPQADSPGRAITGLGWITGVAIVTGFDPQDDTTLRRMMSAPGVTLGIGIPPRTAVAIFDGGETEIVGQGSIAIVRRQT